jgi:hypothetical protein
LASGASGTGENVATTRNPSSWPLLLQRGEFWVAAGVDRSVLQLCKKELGRGERGKSAGVSVLRRKAYQIWVHID